MRPPIIFPFALRFWVNDFAPHFGQRTSPVTVSTFVDFMAVKIRPGSS